MSDIPLQNEKNYYLYILECSNDSYYVGYTTDMQRRYEEHVKGSSKCKYTRSFPPKKIAVSWELKTSLSFVLQYEKRLKNLKRSEKKKLVENPESFWELLGINHLFIG